MVLAVETPDWICDNTGKVIYETKGAARRALRELKGRPRRKATMRNGISAANLSVFKCWHGKHFHFGHYGGKRW